MAVLIGASKGVGACIAEHLAAEGAEVIVNCAISKKGADEVVSRITAKGGKTIVMQGDFLKQEDIIRLFAA